MYSGFILLLGLVIFFYIKVVLYKNLFILFYGIRKVEFLGIIDLNNIKMKYVF